MSPRSLLTSSLSDDPLSGDPLSFWIGEVELGPAQNMNGPPCNGPESRPLREEFQDFEVSPPWSPTHSLSLPPHQLGPPWVCKPQLTMVACNPAPRRRSKVPGIDDGMPHHSLHVATQGKHRVSNPEVYAQNVLMCRWSITSEQKFPDAEAI
jgi:hypothetical protein